MVVCTELNPFQSIEWNTATLVAGGLIAVAVLIAIVLLVLYRKKRKKAPDDLRLYDQKNRRMGKRRSQQSAIRLFDEASDAGQSSSDTALKQVDQAVRLFDEKKPGRRKKARAADIKLFDEESQPVAASQFRPTVRLSEGQRPEQAAQTGSSLPTTLQIFEEPEETYSVGNAQHIGMREEQQDAFGISDIFNSEEVSTKGIFAVLADGMGGLDNGAECSRMVVSLMLDAFAKGELQQEMPDALANMVEHVNRSIYIQFNDGNEESMTGSTVIATLLNENMLYWISVGDSRIYLFRNNRLTQLNREHNYGTLLDENARLGIISTEEAMENPNRAALTSFIGIPALVEVDRNTEPLQLQAGDKILMCSDGLFSALSDEEIAGLLQKKPREAAQELVDRVMQRNRKYQDNVTVIVLGYMA